MNTLEIVYWLRAGLGIVAALVTAGIGYATKSIVTTGFTIDTFINGFSMALIIYIISYYLIKFTFVTKVEKPQKLFTTGIGVYFLAWIVFWVLSYTIIAG
jgi:hypothetical protein